MEMNMKHDDLQCKYKSMSNDFLLLKDQDKYKVPFSFAPLNPSLQIYELQTKSDILEDEMRGIQSRFISSQKEQEEHNMLEKSLPSIIIFLEKTQGARAREREPEVDLLLDLQPVRERRGEGQEAAAPCASREKRLFVAAAVLAATPLTPFLLNLKRDININPAFLNVQDFSNSI